LELVERVRFDGTCMPDLLHLWGGLVGLSFPNLKTLSLTAFQVFRQEPLYAFSFSEMLRNCPSLCDVAIYNQSFPFLDVFLDILVVLISNCATPCVLALDLVDSVYSEYDRNHPHCGVSFQFCLDIAFYMSTSFNCQDILHYLHHSLQKKSLPFQPLTIESLHLGPMIDGSWDWLFHDAALFNLSKLRFLQVSSVDALRDWQVCMGVLSHQLIEFSYGMRFREFSLFLG
jgi:hypothetical protein